MPLQNNKRSGIFRNISVHPKLPREKKNKYNSKKIEIDGHIFDSKLESERYKILKLWVKTGQISDLILQPVFILLDKFERDDKKYRATKYIADFQYIRDDQKIVEDVKGWQTEVSKLKIKWFLGLECYMDIDFRIIRKV